MFCARTDYYHALLGKAYTDALLAAGAAKVYGGARDPASIDNTDQRLVPIKLDLTQDEDVRAAAAACPDVNLLINNAGIMLASPMLAEGSEAALRAEIEVNVFGMLRMVRAFAPVLAKNGGGAIAYFMPRCNSSGTSARPVTIHSSKIPTPRTYRSNSTRLRLRARLKMTATPQRATVILALLFVSSAFGEVIFSRRVYKEHGASYQQIWTWNPADGVLKALTHSPRDHDHPTCDGQTNQVHIAFGRRNRRREAVGPSGLTNNVDPSWCESAH